MKRTLKKLFAGTLLMGLVTVSGLVTILLFPEPLFAHRLKHGPFNVYSIYKIDQEIEEVLNRALHLVKRSELYDSGYTFDVFLGYNSFFNKLDDALLGSDPTARATLNNVIIKSRVDAKKNQVFPTFHQNCEANLISLIAHEMIHCLQENKYGILKFNPFRHPEYWKLEGYPEYISRQEKISGQGYDLIKEIERYIELENKLTDSWILVEEGGCKVPKYYYKSRLMTEYLMNIRHLSYDKILNDTISEDSIFAEMIKWKDEMKGLNN